MHVVSHIAAAIPENGILSEWVYHWLSTVDFAHYAHATTLPSLPLSKVKEIAIPIAPTVEQARIAEALDELFSDLDAGVAALKRARDRLKFSRASVLKAATEGTLTADWRAAHPKVEPASELLKRILTERRRHWEEEQLRKFAEKGKKPPRNWRSKYKEPVVPDTDDLPTLPKKWCWTSLDALILEGPQNGVYLPKTKYGCGTEILRIDDFQNGWIRDRSELKKVKAEDTAVGTYALGAGDLVINRVNSMTHLGKCLIVPHTLEGALFESNMMRATLASVLDPKFIQYYLHSLRGRSRLTKGAKWAVNQASINQQDVRRTPVPLPSYMEQQFIVEAVEDQLSVVDHLEAVLEYRLITASGLRQAILRQAFAGSLLPLDPSGEPASELLKRIAERRKERARKAGAGKLAARSGDSRRGGLRGRPRKTAVEVTP